MEDYRFKVNINWLKRKRGSLLKKLAATEPFVDGSVVKVRRRCGNKNCKCAVRGEKHESFYLQYQEKGATKGIYIPVDLEEEEFIRNLTLLTKADIEKMSHPDTLAYLLEKLPPKAVSNLRVKMANRLIRMKSLEKFRLLGKYYLITIDGTGHLVFKERHCEHCLVMKKGGKILYYYHNVLEAKLVTENGLAVSICTEFIENPDENASKQDCELRAFYRLVKNLKKDFPQLSICLLLDGLYAAGPVFDVCENQSWKYITTFKEGSMSDVYAEYMNLKPLFKETFNGIKKDEIRQKFN